MQAWKPQQLRPFTADHYNTSSLISTNNINDYNYQQNIQTYTDINNIKATFTHRDPPRAIHPLAGSGVCHMINTRKLHGYIRNL
jgi:hypothetical protein